MVRSYLELLRDVDSTAYDDFAEDAKRMIPKQHFDHESYRHRVFEYRLRAAADLMTLQAFSYLRRVVPTELSIELQAVSDNAAYTSRLYRLVSMAKLQRSIPGASQPTRRGGHSFRSMDDNAQSGFRAIGRSARFPRSAREPVSEVRRRLTRFVMNRPLQRRGHRETDEQIDARS